VAVAGIIDLVGDGKDHTEEFLRMLERQGVVVDAYIDLKDLTIKTPDKGKGVTVNTDYLIVGGGSDALSGALARDREYTKRLDAAVRQLKQQALGEGVTVISLPRYLDLIGYKPLHATTEGRRGGAAPAAPRSGR
jgi:hypothetical protein